MARSWQCLEITIPRDGAAAFSRLFSDLGTIGTEERLPGGAPLPFRQPWDEGPAPPPSPMMELHAWFEADPVEDARRLQAVAEAARDLPGSQVRQRHLEEGGWEESWKTRFEPIVLAPDLVVAPPWDPRPGAVILEPGMAFGTGDHPTTRFCLEAIARHGRPGQTLLDVGCGSGILALVGARRGMEATGVDIDPDAVRIAQENARINHLPASFSTTPVARLSTPFDLVVANVFAEEIARMAPDLVRLTRGRLVVTGILADRVHTVRRALVALREDDCRADGEWLALEYVPA